MLVKEGIGVLGMKSMGDGLILKSKTVTPVECLHYAMTLPTSTVITGIDSLEILKQDLEAVKTFKPLTEKQVAALLAEDGEGGRRGPVRAVQDDQRVRRHGQATRVAGGGGRGPRIELESTAERIGPLRQ